MGISIWQLLIILAIVLLLFGTKRLKNLGGDLGGALRGFKSAMKEEKDAPAEKTSHSDSDGDSNNIIEGESTEVKDKDKV